LKYDTTVCIVKVVYEAERLTLKECVNAWNVPEEN
jgi:hypothetical protein